MLVSGEGNASCSHADVWANVSDNMRSRLIQQNSTRKGSSAVMHIRSAKSASKFCGLPVARLQMTLAPAGCASLCD